MRLSARLKKFLVDNCGVKASASDEDFKKATGMAMAEGKLTVEKYTELVSTKEDQDANQFSDLMTGVKESIDSLKSALTAGGDDTDDDPAKTPDGEKGGQKTGKPGAPKPSQHTPSSVEKMITRWGGTPDDDDPDADKPLSIRSVSAIERYSSTKSTLTYPEFTRKGKGHPLAGRPVMDFSDSGKGRVLQSSSEQDMAIAGAYAKFLCSTAQKGGSRTFGFQSLPQHDRELLFYAMEKMPWVGSTDGGDFADIKGRQLTSREQKALIDDATSGGLEAAPIVFDDMVIQAPLLHGELYPLVNTIPLDRGRRVEGVATGTVTGSWGGVDDTAIDLFDTTSYVSAFDTTIFRWEGSIRIGLDFLSDTPIDFGQHVTVQYGERLLEDLDDVIATGNGTTQPEGIMNKTGATSVSWGGATSLGNYESLRFGVAKREHRANVTASAVFCGNETSYMRARAIPVGASDARRLGGMDYSSYQWMERPYKINESMANTQVFYAILARYRMYRRRGLTIRTSTEGDTLIRRNEMLMVAMARYGGQMERGACIARTTTAPA